MNGNPIKTVFGPVPSRRLGRSLGIDVIPPKTCTYDCIYCESGPTTHLTLNRRTFVETARVLRELDEYFQEHPGGADVLTFSSAGEPTLHASLGELIARIKHRYPHLPLIVLTNGSLLWDPAVRRDLLRADRVVPSLDAAAIGPFQRINRPHPALDLPTIVEGILTFRREYPGELHLEVLLVKDVNDDVEHLGEIARVIDLISPDRIELNTVVRPPAVPGVSGLSPEEMHAAAGLFAPSKTQIIGQFHPAGGAGMEPDLGRRILELLRRRPCTVEEIGACLDVRQVSLERTVEALLERGRILRCLFSGREYLELAQRHKEDRCTTRTQDRTSLSSVSLN